MQLWCWHVFVFRYLPTGSSFAALSFQFMRGKGTISGITADTTPAIWTVLQPRIMLYRTNRNGNTLQKDTLIFGTCHTASIRWFPKIGSLYIYKWYFSVILLACADAKALFTTVHVGDFGKNSGGSVSRASTFGEMLEKEELHIPPHLWRTGVKNFPTIRSRCSISIENKFNVTLP
jgi:hypothetical protein